MASKRSKINVKQSEAVDAAPPSAAAEPLGVPTSPAAHDHERSDVNIRGIVGFTVLFAAVVVAMHFGLAAYLGEARTPTIEHQSDSVAQQETFRGPAFQANPHADLRQFKALQKQKLMEYRWVDAKQRRAAVPIDQAISALAAQGLNQAEAKLQAAVEAHAAAEEKNQPAKPAGDAPMPRGATDDKPAKNTLRENNGE